MASDFCGYGPPKRPLVLGLLKKPRSFLVSLVEFEGLENSEAELDAGAPFPKSDFLGSGGGVSL